MRIPWQVQYILERLEKEGYTAYIVGGCVRDTLLNRTPTDWDIATNAKPRQIKTCFSDFPVIDTGIRHGTVTVFIEHHSYEITTFRADGRYSDGRHPDKVFFVNQLHADLARRDFTINAMAYHPLRGLVDSFDGKRHLLEKRIVCVGVAAERFQEDALRILRAVRFASTLGFTVDGNTKSAMEEWQHLLCMISAERITQELDKTLCGNGVGEVLLCHRNILLEVLPELSWISCQEVWLQAARTLPLLPQDSALRLAALLSFCTDAGKNSSIVERVFQRLRYPRHISHTVGQLVNYRNEPILAESIPLKHLLNKHGYRMLQQLILIRRAVSKAKGESELDLEQAEMLLEHITREKQCYRLEDLAINGEDLIALGIPPGKFLGQILQHLLQQVIEEKLSNQYDCLMQQALKEKEMLSECLR